MPLLQQVLEKYPKEVKIVSKNFPLKMHKMAAPAAVAVLAAGEQGKYWEYHEKLFQNYSSLTDERLIAFAKELGLDEGTFKSSMNDPKRQSSIAKDMQDGARAGVSGTPAVFVNGRALKNRSLQGFSELIDAELKKLEKNN